MFGLQHGIVAFTEGELPDILLRHPGDLSTNDGLHTCLKRSHRLADLFLCVLWQLGGLRLFFIFRCKMIFPDPTNSSVVALAFEGFVNVCGGDLPAEFFLQGFTGFDDLIVGIERRARHDLLLLLPFAGGNWVRFKKRKNKLSKIIRPAWKSK
ncbi:hypothetical protein J7412_08460 [Shimia sp. R9_3]|nr:hypothetical protein [Shimia sp. R9_3]